MSIRIIKCCDVKSKSHYLHSFKKYNWCTFFLDFKKINSGNVNKSLKEYLKQYDENETHLRRVSD